MQTTIYITGMEFFAYHGCFEEEKIIGTRFEVDLELDCDISQVVETDDVRKAVDYRVVYQDVKYVMSHSVSTLEKLSDNILNAIREKYSQVKSARIKVSKMNPALGGKIKCVSVSNFY